MPEAISYVSLPRVKVRAMSLSESETTHIFLYFSRLHPGAPSLPRPLILFIFVHSIDRSREKRQEETRDLTRGEWVPYT